MNFVLKRLLYIPDSQVLFESRGFRMPRDSVRARLERVGQTFLDGYHTALSCGRIAPLAARLDSLDLEYRGFAYEGAAMALDIVDQLTPWRRPRVLEFLETAGKAHIYMIHVGLGWSLARIPWRMEARLARLDPLLRWLALDGFGFHEGYFHFQRYAAGRPRPNRLRGYALRAFDQGFGRSMWFVDGADPENISATISKFEQWRHADLWSGVGLACAYAGGIEAEELRKLRAAAGEHWPHLAQGAVFAAGARQRAGNPAPHTDLACTLLCDRTAREAAAISEETRLLAGNHPRPAYEFWRSLIRARVMQDSTGENEYRSSRQGRVERPGQEVQNVAGSPR